MGIGHGSDHLSKHQSKAGTWFRKRRPKRKTNMELVLLRIVFDATLVGAGALRARLLCRNYEIARLQILSDPFWPRVIYDYIPIWRDNANIQVFQGIVQQDCSV